MTARNTKKSKGMGGIKALIATASVAATLVGWAMLPANDPQGVVSASQESTPVALSAQTTTQSGSFGTPSQSLDSLPQAAVPQSSRNMPSPFTRTRSSR